MKILNDILLQLVEIQKSINFIGQQKNTRPEDVKLPEPKEYKKLQDKNEILEYETQRQKNIIDSLEYEKKSQERKVISLFNKYSDLFQY